jgi:hypothetical protein
MTSKIIRYTRKLPISEVIFNVTMLLGMLFTLIALFYCLIQDFEFARKITFGSITFFMYDVAHMMKKGLV